MENCNMYLLDMLYHTKHLLLNLDVGFYPYLFKSEVPLSKFVAFGFVKMKILHIQCSCFINTATNACGYFKMI